MLWPYDQEQDKDVHFSHFYLYYTRGSSLCCQARKRNTKQPNWKEVVKMSLFTNNTAIYVENLTKLLKTPRANEFNKALGYKIMLAKNTWNWR